MPEKAPKYTPMSLREALKFERFLEERGIDLLNFPAEKVFEREGRTVVSWAKVVRYEDLSQKPIRVMCVAIVYHYQPSNVVRTYTLGITDGKYNGQWTQQPDRNGDRRWTLK